MAQTAKQNAINLYMVGIQEGKPAEAIDRFILFRGRDTIQDAFGMFFQALHRLSQGYPARVPLEQSETEMIFEAADLLPQRWLGEF